MKDLVLIHGWGFGSSAWSPLIDALEAGMHVHLVDLPGYGRRDADPERLPAGAVVCAWSLGALLALEWACSRPDKVARLVLMGATPRFVQAPDWPWAQPPALLDDFAAAVADDAGAALHRFAALLNRGDRHARTATHQLSDAIAARRPSTACLLDGLAVLRDADLRTAVADVAQPTLVVHGAEDPLMPLAAGRWLAQHLPQGRIEVFERAAHAPFLSEPRRCADLLAEFAHG